MAPGDQNAGDGALVVFGYPLSGEDDGRRAQRLPSTSTNGSAMRHDYFRWRIPVAHAFRHHAGTLLLTEGDIDRTVRSVGDVSIRGFNYVAAACERAEILATLSARWPVRKLL